MPSLNTTCISLRDRQVASSCYISELYPTYHSHLFTVSYQFLKLPTTNQFISCTKNKNMVGISTHIPTTYQKGSWSANLFISQLISYSATPHLNQIRHMPILSISCYTSHKLLAKLVNNQLNYASYKISDIVGRCMVHGVHGLYKPT
jgi:hypothetical protein